MTVRELIKELCEYGMDTEVCIEVVNQKTCPIDKYTGIEYVSTTAYTGGKMKLLLQPSIGLQEETKIV